MTNDDRLKFIAALMVIAIVIAVNIWWLPQKWQMCQRLFDDRFAQVTCFMSK
jgi:hypothetical protein